MVPRIQRHANFLGLLGSGAVDVGQVAAVPAASRLILGCQDDGLQTLALVPPVDRGLVSGLRLDCVRLSCADVKSCLERAGHVHVGGVDQLLSLAKSRSGSLLLRRELAVLPEFRLRHFNCVRILVTERSRIVRCGEHRLLAELELLEGTLLDTVA